MEGHGKVAENVHPACWLTVHVIWSHENRDYFNAYKCLS